MHRQSAAVDIIRFLAQQVKQLCIDHRNQEIKVGSVSLIMRNRAVFLSPTVSSDSSSYMVISRTSSISKGARRAPQLTRIDFKVLPAASLNLAYWRTAKWFGFSFQSFKHLIHWILKGFIILAYFHRIQEFNQCCKVLLFQRCLIVDITNQSTIQQGLCLRPEFVTGLAVPFGVGNEGCGQLQNILSL